MGGDHNGVGTLFMLTHRPTGLAGGSLRTSTRTEIGRFPHDLPGE